MNEFLTELAALMQKHDVVFEIEPDWSYDRNGNIISDFIMHSRYNTGNFEKAQYREIIRSDKPEVINHETINKSIK